MNALFALFALPYLLALAVWGYGRRTLAREPLLLSKAPKSAATHLQLFPVVAACAMSATLAYPFLVLRGLNIQAVLATSVLSALLHSYLIYIVLFHGVWILSAILRPESKERSEAVRLAFMRAAARRQLLVAAWGATIVLLGMKVYLLLRLVWFVRANFRNPGV